MKTKTSLTLSKDVLAELDSALGPDGNRSAFVEALIKRYFRDLRRAQRDRRDAEIYARMSDADRAEAEEWADLQPDLFEFGDDVELLVEDGAHARAG